MVFPCLFAYSISDLVLSLILFFLNITFNPIYEQVTFYNYFIFFLFIFQMLSSIKKLEMGKYSLMVFEKDFNTTALSVQVY